MNGIQEVGGSTPPGSTSLVTRRKEDARSGSHDNPFFSKSSNAFRRADPSVVNTPAEAAEADLLAQFLGILIGRALRP